jgi:NADH-quinone oxidoreductase subunit F
MDLDIMASVCEHMMGNALCVLADAMAMPIGSMIEKFRPEFEAYIEERRRANDDLVPLSRAPEQAVLQGALA